MVEKTIFKLELELGDPSVNGHSKWNSYTIESNYCISAIYNAYRKSVELTGVGFNYETELSIASEYQSREISVEILDILKTHGLDICDLPKYQDCEFEEGEPFYIEMDEELIFIFFEFIKLFLPDLEYEIISDPLPIFPISIGYGMYN